VEQLHNTRSPPLGSVPFGSGSAWARQGQGLGSTLLWGTLDVHCTGGDRANSLTFGQRASLCDRYFLRRGGRGEFDRVLPIDHDEHWQGEFDPAALPIDHFEPMLGTLERPGGVCRKSGGLLGQLSDLGSAWMRRAWYRNKFHGIKLLEITQSD
jgi:hypothetical protein